MPATDPDDLSQDRSPLADEAAWQHFLSYLRAAPPFSGPQDMLQDYARVLAAEGVERGSIEARIGRLMNLTRVRVDAWPLLFDRIYSTGSANVPERPSPVLLAAVEGRSPGRALDVAVGHGRNAVALALRGWEVTGIDVSEVGLAAAQASAERAGVRLALRREEDRVFDFGSAEWDLLAFIYGPVSITDATYVQRLQRALKQGGLVVVESFASSEQAARRRPVDIDPTALLRAFEAFRIVRFEDVDGVSEWDPQPARLVRLIAQKW